MLCERLHTRESSDFVLFDTWFPLFGQDHDHLGEDRALFEDLLAVLPIPAWAFVVEYPAEAALGRLIARSGWMIEVYGVSAVRKEPCRMAARMRGNHA